MQNSLQFENQSYNSEKLAKLHYLLQNLVPATQLKCQKSLEKSVTQQNSKSFYKNFSLFLELIKKPLNLVFSMDQFLFEFSKKTYQQKKAGEFFQQLKERKKLSLFYGYLTRKQITSIFKKAKKRKGSFSRHVLCLLEQRLDVILFRCGMVETISEARQLIKHKKILVNQIPVTSASCLLEPGDTVSICPQFALELTKKFGSPSNFKKLETDSKLHTLEKQNHSDKHSSIYQDFYKKLKITLTTTQSQKFRNSFDEKPKIFLPGPSQKKLKSKFLSKFLIQLICIQIKSRSYLNLRKSFQEISCLTFLKWKNSSGVDLSFLKKNQLSQKQDSSKKGISIDNSFELIDQIHEFLATRGSLKKESIFWKSWFSHFKDHNFVDLKKNQEIGKRIKSEPTSNWNPLSLKLFRNNYLLFLKNLNLAEKFSGLVSSQLIKFLFKKKIIGSASSKFSNLETRISKVNQKELCKSMHFEVSYKLFELIYLYSPQRIHYPFSIDLDLIKRSLS